MVKTKLPIVVLISGSGSNLQSIIDASQHDLPVEIRAVISNRADAYGLTRAREAGIDTAVLDHRDYPDRESYDAALRELIDRYQPGLLILAGFMRILSDDFVRHYEGRMMNIHPSLLPRYRGLNTHARAIEAGDKEAGCTVHFVTPELDAGPPIIQARVPILDGDTPETLAARVLEQEHRIYPEAIRLFVEGKLG
ncbi:MAG: phosphoribosylglycinamide formyltransferase [Gammaproteobacteria bacterium]|nr:phosphoribosylglycinamide formyltransferase [Gammaproteobacteria bacterium]MCW8928304.1 phosphoribosylglycinamide formyltransferase [Gammaproteobacteria bacterium]MCW8957930.1 phosphoribosylglycinamide formyltransferase [Gammaproteobacteria bacterium]MCW8973717.1 phosphoribosylglycinamide formyltransferase [Gammaproteobacteria bacterium]MCW8993298.1 phosphoribosylglycinamide formyltransferase [Gammaproteobacteria bacterium]